MFVPAHWTEDEIDIDHINLDEQNYRIPPTRRSSPDDMLLFMFDSKGIVPLAESIVRFGGLFPQEKIICLRNGDGSFTVLEGNRRVAAVKLLVNAKQHLASPSQIALLPQIDADLKERLRKVPAWVVESRAVADSAIAGSHIYGNKLGWSDRAKMQFASDRLRNGVALNEVATELAMEDNEVLSWKIRNKIFDHLIAFAEWAPEHKNVFWDERLKLEPFFMKVQNFKIRQHFGEPFYLDDGSPNHRFKDLDKYVYVLALHTLVAQVDKNVSRRLRMQDDLATYLREVFGEPFNVYDIPQKGFQPTTTADLFPDPFTPDLTTSTAGEEAPAQHTPSSREVLQPTQTEGPEFDGTPLTRRSDTTFFRGLCCNRRDDGRLMQLCSELRGMCSYQGPDQKYILEKYRLSFSFLIRATLERCFHYHLMKIGQFQAFKKATGKRGKFSIEDYLRYYSDASTELDIEVELADKLKQLRGNKALINDLHWNVHNDFGAKNIRRLEEISDTVRPVIEYFAYQRSY